MRIFVVKVKNVVTNNQRCYLERRKLLQGFFRLSTFAPSLSTAMPRPKVVKGFREVDPRSRFRQRERPLRQGPRSSECRKHRGGVRDPPSIHLSLNMLNLSCNHLNQRFSTKGARTFGDTQRGTILAQFWILGQASTKR